MILSLVLIAVINCKGLLRNMRSIRTCLQFDRQETTSSVSSVGNINVSLQEETEVHRCSQSYGTTCDPWITQNATVTTNPLADRYFSGHVLPPPNYCETIHRSAPPPAYEEIII